MQEVIEREALFDSHSVCKIVPAGLSENIGDMAALSLAMLSINR
jgi:glucokinase